MSKVSRITNLDGLKLCQRLVQDHGDALRFSISKKGRIWLTFTHWDTEKYNTSVELDGMGEVDDVLDGLAVVAVAHYAKCFKGIAHTDSWTGVEETHHLANDALAICRDYLGQAPGNVDKQPTVEPVPTDNAK